MSFDPYHKWLGIPPKDQPPTHYRLLGIELLETDLDVIENAADQRMRHVRSFQTGQHVAESQRILNEIAQAKIVLLDPAEKAEYDQQFAVPVEYNLQDGAVEAAVEASPTFTTDVASGAPRRRAKQKNPAVEIAKIVAGGIGGTLIAFLLLSFLREDWDKLGIARSVRGAFASKDPAPPENNDPVPPNIVVPPTPVPPTPVPPPVDDKKKKKEKPPVDPMPPAPTQQKFPVITLAAAGDLPAARSAPSFTYARWDNGASEKPLGPVADTFVVSSLIAGYLLGNGEWYDINIAERQGKPSWRLQGSGVMPVAAAATEIRSPYRAWFEDKVEIKRWQKGDAPVQLIHKSDGFAVLSGAQGCFLGPEEVKVYLDQDGYWYLSGKTAHDSRGRAAIFRFKMPGRLKTIVTEYPLKPGDSIKKLRFEDAICSISHITGHFHGHGEALHCEVDKDGMWIFKCHGQQSNAGTVTSIAFDTPEIIKLANSTEPIAPPMPPPPKGKQPVPADADLLVAREALAAKLDDSSAALQSLAEKSAGAERYVLLIAARDKAAAAGEIQEALRVVKAMAVAFEISQFEMTTETLLALRAGVATAPANRELGQLALQHCDEGLREARNKDELRPLAELALAAARAAEDPDLQRRATLKLLELRK